MTKQYFAELNLGTAESNVYVVREKADHKIYNRRMPLQMGPYKTFVEAINMLRAAIGVHISDLQDVDRGLYELPPHHVDADLI